MSILFATATWPHPLADFRHGTAVRMRAFLHAASRLSLPVDLLIYQPADVSWGAGGPDGLRDDLRKLWQVPVRAIHVVHQEPAHAMDGGLWRSYLLPALSVARQPALMGTGGRAQAKGLQSVLRSSPPQLMVVHRLAAMLPALALTGPLPAMALDLDDIEHKAFRRLIELPPHFGAKRLMRLWVPALRRAERRAVHAAAATYVCSPADAVELNAVHGTVRVAVVPNTLPAPKPQPLPGTHTLLFLGIYLYPPNRVAAEHLIADIWPLVRQRHPQARLLIAGKYAHAIAQNKAPPPGVEFLGFVDDLDALYARTQVVACPITSGGGTRIKIIEAALQARPVVSTTLGAEGLEFSAARGELAIADDAMAFAAAVCALFDDPALAARMGQAARARAMNVYDEATVVNQLAARLRALLPA